MAKNTQLQRSEKTERRKLAGMGRAVLSVHCWPSHVCVLMRVCSVLQEGPALCDPVDRSPPGPPWGYPGKKYWGRLTFPPLGCLPWD